MFSSNQKLSVTGSLKEQESLSRTLEFALKMSGNYYSFTRIENPSKCVFQITEDGKYCIGWAYEKIPEGWTQFPFEFDLTIISLIISKFLSKQELKEGGGDGSYDKGFIMEVIDRYGSKKIENPFYGIVKFAPYTCFYAK